MAEITGGEIIAKMLQTEGVKNVFGIIDGTYFGLYSKFKDYGIKQYSPRHEASAAHMAGAYARLTGKLGVCMASNGPGVANILSGLVVEEGEGNRVLVITSSRRTGIMYPDRVGTYQCFNQTGVMGQFAKWSETAQSVERIPELMQKALRKSYEGRPGVVHLDVPEDILNATYKMTLPSRTPDTYRLTERLEANDKQIADVLHLLLKAKYPIIHAGSGVNHSRAFWELEQVIDKLQIMMTTSWGARGAIPESHPLNMPMYYIKENNDIRNEADLVLVLGSRIGETDWWGKAPYWNMTQKVIQVDLDPEIFGNNKPVELAIQADIKAFLGQILRHLAKMSIPSRKKQMKINQKYIEAKTAARQKLDSKLTTKGKFLYSGNIPKTASDVFPEKSSVVFDGGNTVIWSNFYYHIENPGQVLSTFKFGMLGAGIGQALGAAVAHPRLPVCCLIGDGAMGFHPQEIETAVRYNLQIIFLVFCDKQWGMVKMNQHFALKPVKTVIKKTLSEKESIESDLGEIAFDKLAESMGAYGERVRQPKDLKPALERALKTGGCAVIHCDVDPVKHMWAPGLRYFKDLHAEPKGE